MIEIVGPDGKGVVSQDKERVVQAVGAEWCVAALGTPTLQPIASGQARTRLDRHRANHPARWNVIASAATGKRELAVDVAGSGDESTQEYE